MKRISNLKKTLALILATMMALTATAFADWDSFQGNDENNGVTTTGITSGTPSTTTVDLPNNGAWTGVDCQPLVHGSRVYVLYNGGTPGEGKSGGARLACVDTANIKTDKDDSEKFVPNWDIQVGPEADNVSQLATPVLDRDGNNLYGVYTYAKNILTGTFASKNIPAGGSASVTYRNVEFPGSFSNFQVPTGIMGTGKQTGTVTIRKHSDDADVPGKVVKTVTSDSYDGYSFSIYYTDGETIPKETYDITIEIKNNDPDHAVDWTECKLLFNFWQMFRVSNLKTDEPGYQKLSPSGAGNANTPLTFDDTVLEELLGKERVYFGIYDGDRVYCQYDVEKNTLVKFDPPGDDQFYWAGAVVDGGHVYFGGEKGVVYACDAKHFDKQLGNMYITGGVSIRSSLTRVGSYLYFTSTDGKLWRVRIEGNSVVEPVGIDLGADNIAAHSTSTPTIVDKYAYVSTYGEEDPTTWATAGAVMRVGLDQFGKEKPTVTTIYGKNGTGGKVQSSPVVFRNSGTDYVYFTTNTSDGTGYCYRVLSGGIATKSWEVSSKNYALQGFAVGNDFMVFGNDGNELVVIRPKTV